MNKIKYLDIEKGGFEIHIEKIKNYVLWFLIKLLLLWLITNEIKGLSIHTDYYD